MYRSVVQMTEPKFSFYDKSRYDQVQQHMHLSRISYRETDNLVNYRSGSYESHTLQSSRYELIPSICQSQPLIAARNPDRDSQHTAASSHWQYKEEQHCHRQKTTKVSGGLKLLAKTTKRLLLIDREFKALTEKLQISGSRPASTSTRNAGNSRLQYKSEDIWPIQQKDNVFDRTNNFHQSRLVLDKDADTTPLMEEALGTHQSKLSKISKSKRNKELVEDQISNKSCCLMLKRIVVLGLLVYLMLLAFHQPSVDIGAVGQGVPIKNLANEINFQVKSALFGQHIVTDMIDSSFSHALVNNNTKVVTLLMIGPVGTGKSFTSAILQDILKTKGFAVSRAVNCLHHADVTDKCKHWPSYQNLAIFIDGVGHGFQDDMKSGDFIIRSKQCLKFDKILVIIESDLFTDEINQYMFSQCKFKDDRREIQSKDVIEYISMAKGVSVNFESGDNRHVILPAIFLPLDIDHLKLCIQKTLSSRGISKEKWSVMTKDVINLIEFYPQCGNRYPEGGCKLVTSRVDYIINRFDFHKNNLRKEWKLNEL